MIAALARHDPAAMRALYERFSHRVFRFLYRMVGDRAVCDDLHQETWLAAARRASTLRADSDLAAWLFTIARNKARSWGRWRILHAAVERRPDASAPTPQGTAAYGVEGRQAARDGMHDLERALTCLSDDFREVLLLIGCEGLDATQAARVLGISAEAARQRLSRARASLRQKLGADDEAGARRPTRKGAQGAR